MTCRVTAVAEPCSVAVGPGAEGRAKMHWGRPSGSTDEEPWHVKGIVVATRMTLAKTEFEDMCFGGMSNCAVFGPVTVQELTFQVPLAQHWMKAIEQSQAF